MSRTFVGLPTVDDKFSSILDAKYEEICAVNFCVVASIVKMLLLKQNMQNNPRLTSCSVLPAGGYVWVSEEEIFSSSCWKCPSCMLQYNLLKKETSDYKCNTRILIEICVTKLLRNFNIWTVPIRRSACVFISYGRLGKEIVLI